MRIDSRVITTRRVLFEKINQNLLYDFNKVNYVLDDNALYDINIMIEMRKDGMLYGELGGGYNIREVSIANVSHVIQNLIFKNSKLYGDIKFLQTPKGIIAQEIFKKKLATISMRAFATSYGSGQITLNNITTIDIRPKI